MKNSDSGEVFRTVVILDFRILLSLNLLSEPFYLADVKVEMPIPSPRKNMIFLAGFPLTGLFSTLFRNFS